MLNAEKYKESIKEFGYTFALCKGEIKDCQIVDCKSCEFGETSGCTAKKVKWLLEEYKSSPLNEAEREYLSAVIKPFKNRVKSINKVVYHNDLAFIRLTFDENDQIYFPHFRLKSGMYKGMKNNKDYTLEELGL